MGWGVAAIMVAGAFLGYKYYPSHNAPLTSEQCSKIQCKAISKGERPFPDLSDEQKVVVADTLRDLSLRAGKLLESDTQKMKGVPVTLQDGLGRQQMFLILSEDVPSLSSRLGSIGLSVTSVAAGILVQGAMNLLDPDVLTGVATMQTNYQKRVKRGDPSIGLGDNYNQRRQLDALERTGGI
jgi:hypothetical protein